MSDKLRIGIVGLGMIGGSLALALGDRYDVVGYDSDASACAYAQAHSFCKVTPVKDMCDRDVIFACVPVSAMSDTLSAIADICGNSAIITDVASVKAPFAATPGRYVGGHPMAGTERGGIAAAKKHLFQNAYWAITGTGADADTVRGIVENIGAIPISMTAEDHDRAVAMYSHTPHAVAYALTAAAQGSNVTPIAGSGFLDTTRIAQSSEGFWTDVFMLNAKNVSDGIASLIGELNVINDMIKRGDRAGLIKYIGSARLKREALNRADLGGEALYVDLVDRIGEFERVTGAIARAGINVTNIALVPGREGASGALRLEFSSAADRARAQKVLDGASDK